MQQGEKYLAENVVRNEIDSFTQKLCHLYLNRIVKNDGGLFAI